MRLVSHSFLSPQNTLKLSQEEFLSDMLLRKNLKLNPNNMNLNMSFRNLQHCWIMQAIVKLGQQNTFQKVSFKYQHWVLDPFLYAVG